MAPRAQSHVRLRDAPSEEVQDAQDLPRTCRRWWPDFQRPPVGAQLRREVRAAIRRQPERNNFAMWQMNFPATLPNGQRNPVCALGECGDPSCPTYRPKRPEVRQAVEQTILEKCQAHFRAGALKTYASIGCGLLGQDWIVLEQLRELGQLPKRAIFVELRTARPVITGEGAMFPRGGAGGGLNLRQTGFIGELGPEFAFSALLQFESECCGGLIFDFSNGSSDRIFAQLHTKPGALVFGAEGHSFVVEECWEANGQAHSYLFTVSAVGIYNVYRDGEIIARSYGPAPRCCRRQALYVGGRMGGGTAFKGRIQKIKVWDQEVDPMATDLAYSHEVDNAHQTIAQWYKNEMDIYSFGSLAGYAAACEKDRRFAADLLVKIDVHDELDGYDDFVCKALAPDGLALTFGGPGKSWRRSGTGWLPVDMKCEILDTAEEKVLVPWAFMGAFPGHADETPSLAFAARAGGARVTEHGPSGRRGPKQRRPRYTGRKSRQSRQSRERSRACSEPRKPPKQTERWYSMADDAESLENLAKRLFPRPTAIEDLLDEVDLDAAADHSLLSQLDALENEDDDELPGLVLYNQ